MRTKTALPILSGAAALLAAALLYTQRPAVSQTVADDDSVLSFRMRFRYH
jgi:arginine repressor